MSESIATTNQSQQVTSFDFFNPQQFETMQRVCKLFANSELVPDMYRFIPDTAQKAGNSLEKAMANCMIAVDMSTRIGASPLMIMQNLVIIYGRPSWSSKFLVATVNTCGRFEPLKYRFDNLGKIGKIKITEYVWEAGRKVAKIVEFDGSAIDNIQCVAFTNSKGSKEELASSEVSVLMAVQEGWYTKAGSKWKTMQKQMLIYRAASFWTSAYAPEISMGMKTEDEVLDITDIDYELIEDKVAARIEQNANKKVVSFVDTDGSNGKVDSESGEVFTNATAEEKDNSNEAALPLAEQPQENSQPGNGKLFEEPKATTGTGTGRAKPNI